MINHHFAILPSGVKAQNMSQIFLFETLLLDDSEEITIDLFQLVRLVDGGKSQNVIARRNLISGNAERNGRAIFLLRASFDSASAIDLRTFYGAQTGLKASPVGFLNAHL